MLGPKRCISFVPSFNQVLYKITAYPNWLSSALINYMIHLNKYEEITRDYMWMIYKFYVIIKLIIHSHFILVFWLPGLSYHSGVNLVLSLYIIFLPIFGTWDFFWRKLTPRLILPPEDMKIAYSSNLNWTHNRCVYSLTLYICVTVGLFIHWIDVIF